MVQPKLISLIRPRNGNHSKICKNCRFYLAVNICYVSPITDKSTNIPVHIKHIRTHTRAQVMRISHIPVKPCTISSMPKQKLDSDARIVATVKQRYGSP